MKPFSVLTVAIAILFLLSCNARSSKPVESAEKITSKPRVDVGSDTVYKSSDLVVLQLSKHTFQHISFLQTQDFGRVACNGLLITNDGQGLIFDTPADTTGSEELINFAQQNLGTHLKAIILTHFHEDCVGGIRVFQAHHISCFASIRTITFLKQKGNRYVDNIEPFSDSMTAMLGDKEVYVMFLGEGHTKDNIVGYFPADSVLFGGCLIKELEATKGNLEDANVQAWPATVWKVKERFPSAKIVVPGHGKSGGIDLLDYTVKLFWHNI